MQQKNFELRVLVGGKPIREYEHRGNYFVEGRKGSQFELEFKNNTAKRVLAIPSVDGLSVMDGKPANAESMGYVIPAHGSVRIPGWRLDANGVASFIFEDKDRSYARTSNAQSSARAGVVGMLVFEEKVEVAAISTTIYSPPYTGIPPHYGCPGFVQPWQPFWNGAPVPKSPFDIRYTCTGIGVSNTMGVTSNSAVGESYNSIADNAVGASSLTNSVVSNNVAAPAAPAVKSRRVQVKEAQSPFEMGTGFGPKSDFKTNEVKFNKGNEAATLQVFYDSRRNLEKRGIQVVRTQRTYLEDLPSAFSSSGCTPPPGWDS
jgi:hypothetical protein